MPVNPTSSTEITAPTPAPVPKRECATPPVPQPPAPAATPTTPPAWTQEDYEYDMADRIVCAAATIRHACHMCSTIESVNSDFRLDEGWRFWNAERGNAANLIVILLRSMRQMGLDTDPQNLGKLLTERYRDMLRAEAGKSDCGHMTLRYVPTGWLDNLQLHEYIAQAQTILQDYLAQFSAETVSN